LAQKAVLVTAYLHIYSHTPCLVFYLLSLYYCASYSYSDLASASGSASASASGSGSGSGSISSDFPYSFEK
jgi:hypothetical protein